MGWASSYIDKLKSGETVSFRPHGHSMQGRIRSGQLCTVAPLTERSVLVVGDVVLCSVGAAQYLHLVKAIQVDRYLIGNNRGRINGWVQLSAIYGKLISISD